MQARRSGIPDMRQRSASWFRRSADRVPIELCSPAMAAPLQGPGHLLGLMRTEFAHLELTYNVLIKIWVRGYLLDNYYCSIMGLL